MFSDKSSLLEQINKVIKKKWVRKAPGKRNLSPSSISSLQQGKDNFYAEINNLSLARIKERLELLEEQNDQLLYCINFLLEHLPDLILKAAHTDLECKFQADPTNLVTTFTSTESLFENTNSDCPCPTRRERDVLELLAIGYCAKEIADSLFISETTVITHKKNLKKKFNARNTAELISKTNNVLGKKEKK